ncbi:TPA: hypothetical protein N0F65_011169 [Lagenidium giganteum]|uniref:PHD-type domain-containing protein n=1 Tax=Lagenidium giganteum TaxID=4803 RepID=A0AAV2Z8W3_9STRA|nr:TPA: hypothetical protein N0F65_011169 [Lagenidium giganteum]
MAVNETEAKDGEPSDAEPSHEAARMSWDERRQLLSDISNLSPPDIPGVLLLIRNFPGAQLPVVENPPPAVNAWDAHSDGDSNAAPVPTPVAVADMNPIQLQCVFDVDRAAPELLWQLRKYVESCFIPHYVPKENCVVCEGLWSNGHVIACGQDHCSVRIHEECFGVVLREDADGPWQCPSCLLGRQLICAVCLQTGGALKPLAPLTPLLHEQRWVHVLCALTIPELTMRDVPAMEPVDGWEDIENGRFRYLCAICRKRGGASIICEHDGCNVGLHPQCAANAGCMIGSETNCVALYCEKHLPTSRISGAKRWISEEDLVEEIMSDDSLPCEEDDPDAKLRSNEDDTAFILETTASVFAQSRLPGPAVVDWGKDSLRKRQWHRPTDLSKRLKIGASSWDVPGMVVMGLRTQKPLVFPPPVSARERHEIPKFPEAEDAIGAIIDFHVKEHDEWFRARIVQWDPVRKMHLVHFVHNDQKGWAALSALNSLILWMPHEDTDALEGPRVRLYRPRKKDTVGWRPKPRTFV